MSTFYIRITLCPDDRSILHRRKWEQHILTTVQNRSGEKKADYILLRSGQLVGTALIVLCLKEIVGDVRNVEMATKKVDSRFFTG